MTIFARVEWMIDTYFFWQVQKFMAFNLEQGIMDWRVPFHNAKLFNVQSKHFNMAI
jgi:hypothetical protein